jgi:hypothetical protein
MQTYLAAHDEFVTWLDGLEETPATSEIDSRLKVLARCAADRGMTAIHWTFVVDGLVTHVTRKWPGNHSLASAVARGLDISGEWAAV